MAKTDLAVLKYWRSSVADSAIGDACLTSKMLEEFHRLSRKEAEAGVLGQDTIDFLFAEVPSHVRRIAVSYRPSMCGGRADIQDRVVMASRPRSPRSLPRHRSHVKAGSFPIRA